MRPPEAYTYRLKRRMIRQSGYADRRLRDYELDHLIPLDLGGAPADPRNLLPEPGRAAASWDTDRKDELEYALNQLVCAGTLPLAEAQHAIATNCWGGRPPTASVCQDEVVAI